MDNVISIKNINKVYGNEIKTHVLHDINLDFAKGSFSSIIGQSGSGKSTLLNIMGTLDSPSSGDIIINGKSTKNMSKNALAELRNDTIGFIFQFHHLLPEFTALENILMPYYIKNHKKSKEISDRAEELLNLVGLWNVKNNKALNMSGGQQQRTSIARALINNPSIILADEPTGNLDSETTENIYELMRSINENFKTTFVVITHDNRIAKKTDRIIQIGDGKVLSDTLN